MVVGCHNYIIGGENMHTISKNSRKNYLCTIRTYDTCNDNKLIITDKYEKCIINEGT